MNKIVIKQLTILEFIPYQVVLMYIEIFYCTQFINVIFRSTKFVSYLFNNQT